MGILNATASEGKDEADHSSQLPPLAEAIAFRPEGESHLDPKVNI